MCVFVTEIICDYKSNRGRGESSRIGTLNVDLFSEIKNHKKGPGGIIGKPRNFNQTKTRQTESGDTSSSSRLTPARPVASRYNDEPIIY